MCVCEKQRDLGYWVSWVESHEGLWDPHRLLKLGHALWQWQKV